MAVWIVWNILLNLNGLTVEMKNLEHSQKLLLAIFFFMANTSVYVILAKGSQLLKGRFEKKIREELKYTIDTD